VEDYRFVPVEVLRDFALTQSHVTSIRQAADEVGIGRSTYHKFILGRTAPQPRVRRLLALWYLKKRYQVEDIDIARPYATAIETLLAEMPPEQRERAEQKVLTALEAGFDLGPVSRPRWLALLSAPTDTRMLTAA
jgi:hypothetical protein